jgi:hypothetical protein
LDQSQPRQIVNKTLSPPKQTNKTHTKKRTGGVAQVVEHLPSKCEAPRSDLSTAEKQTNKKDKKKKGAEC